MWYPRSAPWQHTAVRSLIASGWFGVARYRRDTGGARLPPSVAGVYHEYQVALSPLPPRPVDQPVRHPAGPDRAHGPGTGGKQREIGRASCRERVDMEVRTKT